MKDVIDGMPRFRATTQIVMQADQSEVAAELFDRLTQLRADLVDRSDRQVLKWLPHLQRAEFAGSMRNLADWLALRAMDLSPFQQTLSELGLSSLGRLEANVRPSLDAVIAALAVISGQPQADFPPPSEFRVGDLALDSRRDALFGVRTDGPETRIMVTLPSSAAEDSKLILSLAEQGADCFRINCAHDCPKTWSAMIAHIREAERRLGRNLPVSMDLGGPKFRIEKVLGRKKEAMVVGDQFAVVRSEKLERGDMPCILLGHEGFCSALEPGVHLSVDDGKLWAVVRESKGGFAVLDVLHAPEKGVKLKPEKGVNLPGVDLRVSALTPEDVAALDFVAVEADLVAFSFVQTPADVEDLIDAMMKRVNGRRMPGVILKIETPLGLRNLPELIVAAGAVLPVGVMIARGDLAVEIGFDRLSEIQEEILWLCEAAQVPVIWATQVLETMVKEGQATRAEVTDAAMSQRAECVMLNKGPHIVAAVGFLRDILGRMDRHQSKKRARLAPLRLWQVAD